MSVHLLHSLARLPRTCYRWPKRAYARWKEAPAGDLQPMDQFLVHSTEGSSFDMTLAIAGISIGVARDLALIASYVPAQRATQVSAMLALRHE